ncbi:hypothetical protein ASZ78_000536 [Callipepla squamata]|uniref:Uncharacterized protein n=1 Tax=Callipepla squamata TaxID=9009 RepID=A0A226MC63_CALSU|nr:hypothetical protein ASZ78_000536 [Callipepla squamata]
MLSGSQHFDVPPRRQLYLPGLSKVRSLMVGSMAKPEGVLMVENDQGEVVQEFMKDTDSINLYKNFERSIGKCVWKEHGKKTLPTEVKRVTVMS